MNKIVLSFLYLCNVLSTILAAFSLIAMSIDNMNSGLFLMFIGIELVFLIITLIYVIIYSKKIKE